MNSFTKVFNHLVSVLTSIVIGINPWFKPQISEHWPYTVPNLLIVVLTWLSRPGQASTFIPKEGTAQLCKTSVEVTKNVISLNAGKVKRLSTSNKEKLLSNLGFKLVTILFSSFF